MAGLYAYVVISVEESLFYSPYNCPYSRQLLHSISTQIVLQRRDIQSDLAN